MKKHVMLSLLTATQEGNYNGTEGLSALPFQGIILAHSNESEWQTFRNNKNNEAFLDRMNTYEALHGVLTRLLAHWAALRTRADWDTGIAREIRAWSAGVPAIDAPSLDPSSATQMGLGLGA